MLTVCHGWYQAHTALADGIFLALVGLAALSWAVTFLRWAVETVGYVLADGWPELPWPAVCGRPELRGAPWWTPRPVISPGPSAPG